MNRSTVTAIALVLVAILFVAINVYANNALRSARLDLTNDGLFTLSEGSHNIITSVQEPIRLRFYFSESLAIDVPTFKSYGNRVRELLEEYASLSNDKIRLEVIDPEPFTDAEDEAVRAGLQAVPLASGESLYFGLVGRNTTDDEESIPFFSQDKEQFLEYDVTRLIYNLTDPERPVVGLITGHQMNAHVNRLMRLSGGPEPWAIVDVIRELFELKVIDINEGPVPDDVDVLLLVHPIGLDDTELYRIDQYVLGGGRAVVYVDPHSEVAASAGRSRGQPAPPAVARSELEKLFEPWGISVDPDSFVGDYAAAQQVNAGYPGNPKIVRYLAWLQLEGNRLSGDDVITSRLGPLVVASAGTIETLDDATTDVEPLVTTSSESMLFPADDVRVGPQPDKLLADFKADGSKRVIAARVSGPVKSAFPDGPPKPEPEAGAEAAAGSKTDADGKDGEAADGAADETPAHLSESKEPINVIVVADSDLLYDQFWLRRQELLGQNISIPIASNADMLVNALDNLAGSSDLIGLRSRGKSARPFEVVEALRRNAEQKFLARERQLRDKLEKTQQSIAELESRASAGGGALLTNEQQAAIQDAREEVLKTRKELRDVQRDLNRDIERLETQLKFANIGLIPILVAVLAVVMAGVRYRRRRRRADTFRT